MPTYWISLISVLAGRFDEVRDDDRTDGRFLAQLIILLPRAERRPKWKAMPPSLDDFILMKALGDSNYMEMVAEVVTWP